MKNTGENKSEQRTKAIQYGGIAGNIVDNILRDFGISKKMVKDISKIVESVADHVEVQELGAETFVTIHLNKIHFKFKK